MAGLKRRPDAAESASTQPNKKSKSTPYVNGKKASSKPSQPVSRLNEFANFSDDGEDDAPDPAERAPKKSFSKPASGRIEDANGDKKFKLATSSAEAHATQRALAKERKANKPNADLIARSKKIWERLRRKSHVPLEERKELVAELYAIVNGRVRDFVFKHDSVRIIQCALKYANKEQRLNITRELQADMRALVESKYGKFMVAKIVVEGDQEIRDMVIPEFYGHIRRLLNHPEAAWIVDDIYRQVATSDQKARMLREWYGAEFALDNKVKDNLLKKPEKPTSDLPTILAQSPEKRKPILNYVYQLINQLIQKKMTGFTMLHDAMLQYRLSIPAGSEEANEFHENLKSDLDEESGGGDLLKNLAFTKSGSRVVSLALAHGSAKDRKQILRVYKDVIDAMALDVNAYTVLLTALEVADDTKMSSKGVYPDLVAENIVDAEEKDDRLIGVLTHRTARILLLYPLASDAKWLVPPELATLLEEVHKIREETSKKAPETRHAELARYSAEPMLSFIARKAEVLIQSTMGCQAVAEILLSSPAYASSESLEKAVNAIVELAGGDPEQEGHISSVPAAGKMLRTLCQGGRFDPKTKAIVKPEKEIGFANALYNVIGKELLKWATGPSSFVVVAMTEGDLEESKKKALLAKLEKEKKSLQAATQAKGKDDKPNAGAKILLEKL